MRCETSQELLLVLAACERHFAELTAQQVWEGVLAPCTNPQCGQRGVR